MSLISFDFKSESDANRGFASVGVIIAALVLIGGGAFAYTQFSGSGNGSGGASAGPPLGEVVAAHQDVETFQHETTISSEANLDPNALSNREDAQRLRQVMQFVPNISAQGGFPSVVNANLTFSGNASVSTTTFAETQSNFSVGLGEEEASEILSVEFRRKGGLNYVRAETLPSVGFFDLSSYEGKWYSFEAEDASRVSGSFQTSGFQSAFSEDLPEDVSVSKETTQKLIAAMQEEEVITFSDVTDEELSDGTSAYRMDVQLDPDEVEAYAQRARDILEENNPELASSTVLQSGSQEMKDFKKSVTQMSEQFDTIRLWVQEDTNYLRKVALTSSVNASELQQLREGSETNLDGFEDATINIDVALSSYNESVEVTAPENATPFSEVFGSQQQFQPDMMQ